MSNRQLVPETVDRVENLTYTPLEKKYLKVQFASTLLAYLCLMGLPPLLFLTEEFSHRNLLVAGLECLLLAAALINLTILPKAYCRKGYAIREHDITYRSGLIFPSVTTIPFCKIQQVSVQQHPVARLFGLYAINVVNGAQLLEKMNIPGLTETKAHEIKALILKNITHEKE